MNENTLMKNIERFTLKIDNLKSHIKRVADYIIKKQGLCIAIDRVDFYSNNKTGLSSFVIVLDNGMAYIFETEAFDHCNVAEDHVNGEFQKALEEDRILPDDCLAEDWAPDFPRGEEYFKDFKTLIKKLGEW